MIIYMQCWWLASWRAWVTSGAAASAAPRRPAPARRCGPFWDCRQQDRASWIVDSKDRASWIVDSKIGRVASLARPEGAPRRAASEGARGAWAGGGLGGRFAGLWAGGSKAARVPARLRRRAPVPTCGVRPPTSFAVSRCHHISNFISHITYCISYFIPHVPQAQFQSGDGGYDTGAHGDQYAYNAPGPAKV